MKRKQHHTPRSYLAGFTLEGTASGRIHVLNLRNGREWKATPGSAAHRRDYYRVAGANPDAFEDELGRMEAAAMAVIHEIHEALEVPTGERLQALLTFVAGMGARTRPHRDHFNREETRFLEVAKTCTPRTRSAGTRSGEH
jgi:hypothetical protein